jgi:hypothetical protein
MIKLQKNQPMFWLLIFIIITVALASCNLPQSAPPAVQPGTVTTEEVIELPYIPAMPEETAIPVPVEGQQTPQAEVTSQVFLPKIESLPVIPPTGEALPSEAAPAEASISTLGPKAELAYLNNGNLTLVEVPAGSPRQLTTDNDLLSFAWSPDGNLMATFNGTSLCFIQPDGASAGACLDLKLDENQSKIKRQILWSPDKKSIVLWNSTNPWDEEAIGWVIVSLETPDADPILIQDPVDWGVELTPENDSGGITGQPIFLPNGALLGSLTHRWLCGSSGCHYQLFQFDLVNRDFSAFPNQPQEGFSEGQNLVLSQDGNTLTNFGTFMSSCDDYFTFVDLFHLDTQTREIFNLDQEAIASLTLSPDNRFAVIARTAGCSDANQETWASTCGLSTGMDIYPMQIWDLTKNERSDLLPGANPGWSSDGSWLAFNSCLAQDESGNWEASAQGILEIFVRSFVDGSVIQLGPGAQPSWRP